MSVQKISRGVAHTVPKDVWAVLHDSPKLRAAWESLTPLARNEWLCWIVSVKRAETRANHLRRFAEEIVAGKRRPCCFAGCPHR